MEFRITNITISPGSTLAPTRNTPGSSRAAEFGGLDTRSPDNYWGTGDGRRRGSFGGRGPAGGGLRVSSGTFMSMMTSLYVHLSHDACCFTVLCVYLLEQLKFGRF